MNRVERMSKLERPTGLAPDQTGMNPEVPT